MQNSTNGVIWSAIEQFSVQGITFLLNIVIARLITPDEFGLIAMLSIFIAIAQTFIDSGFGNALIQKNDRNEIDYSTVFYFNIIVSLIIYGILYFCAPLISRFYNEPDLTAVTRWIGLSLIFISLSIVQRTRLTIELNFKLQAKISLVAVILSGILGIILAYNGWGVWALVFQSLSNNLLSTIFLWFMAKWHPMFEFSITSFKRLFSFGSKLLASGLLHTIYLNLYSLVIGKFYNAADVGFYNRANSISQFPSKNIMTVISRVEFPLQCSHQDDNEWLNNNFVSYLRMSCFIIFPLMMLLAINSKSLVLIILTEKWLPVAELISILSFAYLWDPVTMINNQMLKVKGRSDLFLKAEIIKKIVAIAILCITLPFGLIWLCIGICLYNIFDMVLIICFTKKIIPIGYMLQLRAIIPILSSTLLAGLITFAFTQIIVNTWFNLCIGITVFITIYILASILFKIDEIYKIKSIIYRYIKSTVR